MTQLAPVVLFCYKRLDTLIQTVEALKKNFLAPDSELYVFSDAAKNDVDKIEVDKVRSYVNAIEGFKSLTVYEATENMGLANSIIQGVSKIFLDHEKIVVLEDDLVTSANFLNFMNEGLIRFNASPSVFSISGYSFNLNKNNQSEFYFLNRGWSWGWSTWKNRWDRVDWNVSDYERFSVDRESKRLFAKGGSDLNQMLKKQMNGDLDSWAIRWFYAQFKEKGLTLYPKISKIRNVGFGMNSTHTRGSSKRYIPIFEAQNNVHFEFPRITEIDTEMQKSFQKKMGYIARIRSKIETILGL